MKELFSLGEIYPSDFLAEGESPRSEKVEMKLIMDDDGLVRLEKTASMDKMYGKYWYRSGINSTMKDALKDVVDSVLKIKEVKTGEVWLDIACNDGTLLSYAPKGFTKVGIDPADDTYKWESVQQADLIIQEFFSREVFEAKLPGKKASVVTSIAMFYDVPDPKQFIKDVYDILEDDGLWVMQLSYSPLMIEQMAFDNICHEHIYYYSLTDLYDLLALHNFSVIDCELNDINGGSIRIYIKKGSNDRDLITPAAFRVLSLLTFEDQNKLDYIEWFNKIKTLKQTTVDFITYQKSQGKTIWAYGASTKGNTLLQYFGLDS